MKASEVHSLTLAELQLKEHNLREALQKLRFRKYTGELSNTSEMRKARKDLARVLTEIHARTPNAESSVEAKG